MARAHTSLTFLSPQLELPMSASPLEICIEGGEPPDYSLSALDQAIGPLGPKVEFRCQEDLRADFARHCRTMNRDVSQRLRELMALDVYGPDHVQSLLQQQIAVLRIGGGTSDPAAVRTGAITG